MTNIPVIDMRRFYDGDAATREALAHEVDAACRDTGFLTVAGHKVSPELVTSLLQVARAFFSLPVDDKLALRAPPDTMLRGYSPFQTHRLARSRGVKTPPDLREIFSLGRPGILPGHAVADPDAAPFYRPNIWPARPPQFREIYTRYYELVDGLAADLMRLFALALDLPEAYFADKIDDNFAALNTYHYPPQTEAPLAGQLRAGAHSDFGSLTILLQEPNAGGLEVMGTDGAWHYLPPQPGRFVINIGDLMAQWTNDHWVSTLHRVVNPPRERAGDSRRQSLVFFHNPNYDAPVECLPSCRSAAQAAKYQPTTSGEYLRARFTATQNSMAPAYGD
jgi:isopenicillin N synthase-like dioxygenase